MATEYRIVMTATFNNAADRDAWYTKVKTAWQNAKATSPVYKAANMTKDDYEVPEVGTTTESV
jgi:hypothetical protein